MQDTKLVDYDKVVNMLMQGLVSEDSAMAQLPSRADTLREYRTISWSTGRQKGHTEWIVNFFIQHAASSVVFMNNDLTRKDFIQRLLTKSDAFNPSRIVLQSHFVTKKKLCKDKEEQDKDRKSLLPLPTRFILLDNIHPQYLKKPLYQWLAEFSDPDPVIINIHPIL